MIYLPSDGFRQQYPLLRDVARARVRRREVRYLARSTYDLDEMNHGAIFRLNPVTRELVQLLYQALIVLARQVTRYLDPKLLRVIAGLFELPKWIILAESAGFGNQALLGQMKSYPDGVLYISTALTIEGRRRTIYEIAGTLFHELIHVAELGNPKLKPSRYQRLYRQYDRSIGLDEFTYIGAVERSESIVRAFHGSLFGIPSAETTQKTFDEGVDWWRNRLPQLVELVNEDQYSVFSDRSFQLAGEALMTQETKIVRMVAESMSSKLGCVLEDHKKVFRYEPLYRGTLLWLREQARQAEADPNREWHGYRAEFDQLLAGTHPDPHPEKIILGQDTDNFDPATLTDPKYEIWASDGLARHSVTLSWIAEDFGYPLNSQQLFAALCGEGLDRYLQSEQRHCRVRGITSEDELDQAS